MEPSRVEYVRRYLRVVYVALCGWSADGQRLAYIVRGESWGDPHVLCVLDLPTGQVTRIGGYDTDSASWSLTDPELLVMNQFVTPYLVNVRTGQQVKVDELEDKDIRTIWAPDGRRLLATVVDRAIHPVKEEGIVIVDKDTRTSQWLDVKGAEDALWSPDGRKIAYVSNLSGDRGIQKSSLLVISNGKETKLLVEQDVLNVYARPFAWSLDSKWIVGFGNPPRKREVASLYLVNAETGEMTVWAASLAAPGDNRMVWCYQSCCVNGGWFG